MSEKDYEHESPPRVHTSISCSGTQTNVSEEEKKLSDQSQQDFHKGSYKSCMAALEKLLKTRSKDPKVIHNKCVAEFYKSDQKTADEFRKSLQQVCAQLNISLENVDSLDDVDHCIYYFNHAVILYHSRQYQAAIVVLDKVFQFIEPLEESLGRKVCLLLVELYLRTFQPDKALGMIGYMENAMLGNLSKADLPEDVSEFKTKLQQLKARGYIMLRSVKGCKREIKGLVNAAGLSPSAVFLKGNVEYIRNNARKAIKILGGMSGHPSLLKSGDNIPVMYYNNLGCIHFYMKKPNLGNFYFQKALQENEKVIKEMKAKLGNEGILSGWPLYAISGTNHRYDLLYNIGIQWLHARKPHQAFDCIIEVLQVYPSNPRLWLRLAECCIQAYEESCSLEAGDNSKMLRDHFGTGFHRKLIIAAAIAGQYKPNIDGQSSAIPMATLEFAYLCLKNALLLLQDSTTAAAANNATDGEGNPDASQQSVATGEDGGKATRADGDLSSVTFSSAEPSNVFIPTPPGNPIHGSEIANLSNSVLVASAYVALCLQEYVMALKHADALLAQPQLSATHRFLGHLYAGEAKTMLNQLPDAIAHFNSNNLHVAGNEKEEDEEKCCVANNSGVKRGWNVTSVDDAKAVLQYNMTVAYTLQNDFEKASDTLRQLNINNKGSTREIPVQPTMLAMYIQAHMGHADLMRSIVKQHCPQFR